MFIEILISTVIITQDTTRLTIERAIDLARNDSPTAAAIRAEGRAARASVGLATPAFLPTVTLDGGYARTTDPVAVFGMKLRQENFQASDLALDALNRPDPYGGFSLQAAIQQPILAPEGIFGYRAATKNADAMEAASRRRIGYLTFNVIKIYRGSQLARANVRTLETAYAAALSHADRAAALKEQGLATGLDSRLASVRAAEINARLIAARAVADNALAGLRTLLGLPETTTLVLADDSSAIPGDCTGSCDAGRADVEAARAALDAANMGVLRAQASNLPSIVAFANAASYDRMSPFGGSGDWTIGIGVRWNPFRGTAGLAAVGEARAVRDQQRERLRALTLQSSLEIETATRLLEAASERQAVARAAVVEADSALAHATLRYQTGVSSITELLDVQAAHDGAQLNLSAADHDVLVARAALAFAYGEFDR